MDKSEDSKNSQKYYFITDKGKALDLNDPKWFPEEKAVIEILKDSKPLSTLALQNALNEVKGMARSWMYVSTLLSKLKYSGYIDSRDNNPPEE